MKCKVQLYKAGHIFEETVYAKDYEDAKEVAEEMPEESSSQEEDLSSLTVAELKEIAKSFDIKISGLRKSELIDAINSAR